MARRKGFPQSSALSLVQTSLRSPSPRTYISKIGNGKVTPTLPTMVRLAGALQAGLATLLRDSTPGWADEVTAFLADPFLAEMASLLPRQRTAERVLALRAARQAAERTLPH